MTADRFAALRAALEAEPTPGPWHYRGTLGPQSNPDLQGPYVIESDNGAQIAIVGGWRTGITKANAAIIAACDPDTLRALLAERDELKRRMQFMDGSQAHDYHWYQNAVRQALRVLRERMERK